MNSSPIISPAEQKYEESIEGDAKLDAAFAYGWGLIRSGQSSNVKIGLGLLKDLATIDPKRSREAYFFSAVGYSSISDYKTALKYAEMLLEIEPDNTQAIELKQDIESKMKRDGMIGLALVGGLAAVAVGAIIGLTKRR